MRTSPLRTVCYVLATAGCYYLATQVAWVLCFPESKVSLVFPPHAVLLCILLLVPARHWWAYVLAAVSVHFLATQQEHWPPIYALNCEVFDAVKCVAAAAGIRLLIKSPLTAITLRDATLFVLVAGVLAPFGTAFWGAAFTLSYGYGTRYWIEWRNLGVSNAVTGVVLVPVFLLCAHYLLVRPRILSRRRALEAGVLFACTVALGVFVFDAEPAGPGASPALLYTPIPLLVWAALRFGLAGIGVSMLIMTFEAIWGTMRGHGPFLAQTPTENVLALQLFLLVTAIPLMLLAVAIEQLRRHHEGLETLVATRTAELRAATAAAEDASRAKGAFLANMSHEIRTPMNAILGYAQLLEGDGTLDPAQQRKVAAIHTSGDHLLGLLNDVLEMSRIEAARVTPVVKPFDLPGLIDGVRSMFVELTARRGLRFDVDLAPGLQRGVCSDAGRIRQVLINLLGNAIKFTDRGGIAVRASSRDLDAERCLVTIEVEDSGHGIAADDQEEIFAAFGQSDSGKQRSGTGLGLTISRSVARLLGGDLTVRSTVGSGSTFTFTFVASRTTEVELPSPRPRRYRLRIDETAPRRKALVVDDVPSNRELLEETLSRAGIETRGATSADEALEMTRDWRPDLVMMDLHMPGTGGLAAIERLRAEASPPVIVVTTAGADDGAEAKLAELGVRSFLRKPYHTTDLFTAIGGALQLELVELAPAEPTPASTSSQPLRVLVRDLSPELIAELVDACRGAYATRLLQLADRVAEQSSAAADAIRRMANDFAYAALLDALTGAPEP